MLLPALARDFLVNHVNQQGRYHFVPPSWHLLIPLTIPTHHELWGAARHAPTLSLHYLRIAKAQRTVQTQRLPVAVTLRWVRA